MEVVGAVASFIAIGQALSTARHVAHIARAIPGIENELRWLQNEVEALGLIEAELARAGVIASDSKFETMYLEKAMLQLTESTRSLEEIRKRCTRPLSADGKDKIKKRAWFWLQAELADCRSKARDARENLQLALQSINAQSITKLVLQIESLSMQIVPHVQRLEGFPGTGDAPESPKYIDETSTRLDEDSAALQDDKTPQAVAAFCKIGAQFHVAAGVMLRSQSRDASPNGVTALEIWEDQILNGNYDDSWFYEAHDKIVNTPSLPEEKMQVLTRILSAGKWTVNASQTPLHDALCRGDFDAAFQAAEDSSWALNQRNYEGNTPLHIAATQGHLNSVKHLVRLGCDINEANWTGCTALMLASKGGHILTVQYLIDAGSWVNATDRGGDTAMMIAATAGHDNLAAIIRSLIRAGASVNITDQQGFYAIHHLTSSYNKGRVIRESLRVLLEAGADIESRNRPGRTPLLVSIQSGDCRGTQCLIEAGAKTTYVTRDGWGLLHEAALYGTTKTLRYLSTLNLQDINTGLRTGDGETPWDYLVFSIHAQDWQRAGTLTLTSKRQEAFVSLFKSIRDTNLTVDIERLDWLLQYLRDSDQRGAIAALSPLIKQKKDWKRWEILGTYKAIGLQIREEMWEAAVESVEEVIDCLRERMATSPCDSESYYDPKTHTIYRARELV
ncbi:pfs domain-containing protein [Colletotrichum costaricense]|uniref:Pfs domain-containing protein n=1 Tax=Colletotrichum costaricense TaxID=1209916 RepID=A0AAJ0DVN4_9PEZI|nr:pfs domain-containing protein [Colletotrichum costaricense]KAK1515669.1 pfs domain-containing protein [Colletotrichum costaricense]